ncbi:MAG: PEP-CTERM sorting domain-containing protein, partial [Methylicorpusculum sp.]|nr:PEP-CTERM sorting domain-containing protein [Methylicorpusculum sp.]
HKQNVHFQMIGDVRFIQNNFGFETSSGYASLLITTTPDFVPVPGAMLLMGTGLLGLIAYGRKKAA